MLKMIRIFAFLLLAILGGLWGLAWYLRAPGEAMGDAFLRQLAQFGGADMPAPSAGGVQLPQGLALGGAFSLQDHTGQRVTERAFAGRLGLIYFGFTYCPDVCPTTLTEMTGFIEALGPDSDRIQWVFVSVDAERDTPQAMAAYLEAFDRRIIGLTGTEAQIAAAANGFRVFYRRVPLEGGGYTMDHSASVFLLDAAGRFAGALDYKESEQVALEKLRMLVGQR
jgi:protein SCO1/2